MNTSFSSLRFSTCAIALALSGLLAGCSANGGGPDPSTVLEKTADPNRTPPNAPAVTLTLDRQRIAAGESARLSWTTTDATHCEASGAWSGPKPTSNPEGLSTGPLPAGTHTVALSCTGPGGSSSASRTLLVGEVPAPGIEFALSAAAARPGDSIVLSWSTSNALSCVGAGGTGSDGWAGARATSSSGLAIGPLPAGEFAFDLACTGPGGTTSETRVLTVAQDAAPAPPQLTLTATPAQVTLGQSLTLSWNSANVTSCAATGGSPGDGWAGPRPTQSTGVTVGPLTVAGQYAYEISCSGAGGTISRAKTVVAAAAGSPVPPVTVAMSISPSAIAAGQSATLTWTATGADQCTASGSWSGPRVASGTEPTGTLATPGTYSYALMCSGPGGNSTDTATLVVGAPRPRIRSFAASPQSVTVGLPVHMSWETDDATACTASGGTGSDAWTGAVAANGTSWSVGPLATLGVHRYTLTCAGSGGTSEPEELSVTVLPAPQPAAVTSLSLDPNTLALNQSAHISWATTNATSCIATGGTGSDGWSGTIATNGAAVPLGTFTSPGVVTYTLTCTGPGGTGAPASASLNVGSPTPPASIGALVATPATVTVGQSSSLSWTSTDATACTATGGTGTDAWGGVVATTGSNVAIGPFATPGTHVYTLSCAGPGGTSGPTSAVINVNPAPALAAIETFSASPASALVGQSTTLSWSTANATSCSASAGTTGDGWSGAVPTSSTGTTVGPFASAGTVPYTISCTGSAGNTATQTLNVVVSTPPPGAPTVTLTANDQSPTTIQPGSQVTLKWSSTNATSCTATGGSGLDAWGGARSTSSNGTAVGPIATPGVYTYGLTCSGAGGSASASVTVVVISSPTADCGIGTPSTLLLAPTAAVSTSVNGVCVLGCGVSNAGRTIDASPTNYATMSVNVGVAAYTTLRVTDSAATYPAGRKAGFLISDPDVFLSLNLLQNLTVRTLRNGVVQESASGHTVLELSALGLFADTQEAYVGFRTTKPFDAVRLDLGSLASVADELRVYGACVTLQ